MKKAPQPTEEEVLTLQREVKTREAIKAIQEYFPPEQQEKVGHALSVVARALTYKLLGDKGIGVEFFRYNRATDSKEHLIEMSEFFRELSRVMDSWVTTGDILGHNKTDVLSPEDAQIVIENRVLATLKAGGVTPEVALRKEDLAEYPESAAMDPQMAQALATQKFLRYKTTLHHRTIERDELPGTGLAPRRDQRTVEKPHVRRCSRR